jgi:hypothetical protein
VRDGRVLHVLRGGVHVVTLVLVVLATITGGCLGWSWRAYSEAEREYQRSLRERPQTDEEWMRALERWREKR